MISVIYLLIFGNKAAKTVGSGKKSTTEELIMTNSPSAVQYTLSIIICP